MSSKVKKIIIASVPYVLVGLVATDIGEAIRLSQGANASEKFLSFFTDGLGAAFTDGLISFHPFDLLIGALIGGGLKGIMYLRAKNAKKYRHGEEYGSARWGNAKDIEPYVDPDPMQNVILTKTEGLMMSNRPSNPKYARNKNVLVVGGSGSGKTRFFIKPNLLQMHSSYVCTDPNGYNLGG